jgi:diguanylate cyclase (GGDEF)-like protein
MIGAFLAELHRGVLDKRHSLERAETVIGRDMQAHIRVDDGSVSRRHAAILRKGERYVIKDLGSRNGTTVNEEHLSNGRERDLKVNDCIFLGKAVLCFLLAEERMGLPTDTHLDPLTEVPNRQWFLDQLALSMSEARIQHRPLAVSLVGIDDVAGINERWGQGTGDMVIRHVAKVIAGALEPGETMARYRGAVFGVISPDLLDGLVLDRAEKLRAHIEDQPAQQGGDLILIGASVGVTPMMALDQEKLLESADAALSRAKQRGSSVERASRSPDAETERFQRRLVPQPQFTTWLRAPAIAFVITGGSSAPARSRRTIIDFELHAAIQQNLSGDELATYPDTGGAVLVTVPASDGERVPRLCEAIRSSFERTLAHRTGTPIQLKFGDAVPVSTAQQALSLLLPKR